MPAFTLLINRGPYFYSLTGVVSDGKIYFCTPEIAVAFRKSVKWSEEVASCKMKDVSSAVPNRREDWVVEYGALMNELNKSENNYLSYLLRYGYVKREKGRTFRIVEEKPDKDSVLLTSWMEQFRKPEKKGIRV